MRKATYIFVLGGLGFLLIQAAKATEIGQNQAINKFAITDTTGKVDTVATDTNDDPKLFKNLLHSAYGGDGVTGARLNPMAISFVKNYISKNKTGFLAMKDWARPHFDMMDKVLAQHGVPKEMKYLAVIESGLKHNAKSWAGACGPWAFMPAAAVQYGLRINRGNDERLDYFKSTHAAARMLTELFLKYNDWLLVLAAYNCGPGNVDKAIRRSGGSRDFWTLQYHLPVESMNHVKKFIGTHYIFEGEGGVTTVTKKEMRDLMVTGPSLNDEEMNSSTTHNISGRFSSAVILKYIDLDKATFEKFNPAFDQKIAVEGKYQLRLPTPKMNIFVSKRYEILDESMKILLETAEAGTK